MLTNRSQAPVPDRTKNCQPLRGVVQVVWLFTMGAGTRYSGMKGAKMKEATAQNQTSNDQ